MTLCKDCEYPLICLKQVEDPERWRYIIGCTEDEPLYGDEPDPALPEPVWPVRKRRRAA